MPLLVDVEAWPRSRTAAPRQRRALSRCVRLALAGVATLGLALVGSRARGALREGARADMPPMLGHSTKGTGVDSRPLKPTSGGKHRELPRNPSFGPPIERPGFRPTQRPEVERQPAPASDVERLPNASSACTWHSYRLPTDVLPAAYNLVIEMPSLTPPAYVYGSVDVSIDRNASAPAPRCLVFHVAPEVQVDALALVLVSSGASADPPASGAGRLVDARIARYDAEWSQMHVELDEPIEESAILSVSFSYELRDKLTGLYHSRYTGIEGTGHSIATTQHEATSARETFPCWDEPGLKATFALVLHVPDTNGTVALSNMPAVSTRTLVVPPGRHGSADETDADDVPLARAQASGRWRRRLRAAARRSSAGGGAAAADDAVGDAQEEDKDKDADDDGDEAEAGWGIDGLDESLRAGRLISPEDVQREALPLKRVEFGTSPRMATYLVAFTVGEFEAIRTQSHSGVQLSAWAPAATRQVARLQYALQIARDALNLYEKLLGVPFPLPKIDIVSIPDFGPGAMENWGLVTYRATSVLADESSAPGDRQSVACTVVHELGHQWTGNLVTMRWWDELWLNEGFANFFEQAVTNVIAPELMIAKQHVQYLSTALHFDSSPDTHAVRPVRSVASDSAIEALFDSISYDKAGAIIYMLHDYLSRRTPGAFVAGLCSYLTEHQFGSASGADMWEHLGKASGLPIGEWVEPWFSQAGYPLIEVTTLSDGSAVLLQVGRFMQDLTRTQIAFGGHATADQATRMQSWWVPISYFTSVSSEVHVSEIASSSSFFSIPPARKQRGGFDAEGSDWLKVNFKGAGYYRVNYPPHLWARLVQASTEPGRISDADLANLIDDAFALTLDGRLSGVILSLARALGIRTAHESTFVTSSYESWQAMSSGLTLLLSLVADATQASSSREGLIAGPGLDLIPSRCVGDLQRFVRTQALGRCLDPLLSESPPTGRAPPRGSTDAPHAAHASGTTHSRTQLEALAKPVLLQLASAMGDSRVGVWASGPLRPCLDTPDARCGAIEAIPPELRFACLDICAAFDVSGQCWQLVLGQLPYADNDPAYRWALLSALSRAPTERLLNATLGLVMNPAVVRAQDMGAMVSMLAGNSFARGARQIVWEYARANAYALLGAAGGAGSFDFGGLLSTVASGFASEEMAQDVETFLALNPVINEGVPARITRAVVGKIRSQAIWVQNYGADTCAVLASFHA